MAEKVMVVDADWLNVTFGENSDTVIITNKEHFINKIETNYKFILRDLAETDTAYKQIISYCLIVHENDLYITQRTAKQTEKRLHNCYCVGIGGHINSVDSKNENILITGMLRELSEEVNIQCEYTYDFYGIINDNSSEVNSVHVGVCFIVRLNEKKCSVKETEKMRGFWINKDEIGLYKEDLEGWSKIFLTSYYSNYIEHILGCNRKVYHNTIAENYLCVPSVFETIFKAEGILDIDKYKIANYFGITLPSDIIYSEITNFSHSDDPKKQGVFLMNNSINEMFKAFHLPFKEQYIRVKLMDQIFLAQYIYDELSKGKHIICGFEYHSLYKMEGDYAGHVSIIININLESDIVFLLDPGPKAPGIKKVNIYDLYNAMLKANDGLWIITKYNERYERHEEYYKYDGA